MKRNLRELEGREFDLVVVGGGIYGAAAAWDATLRGLSVALVERGDFGGGTSFNSSKTIHGGLRYLQHADLRRMRESVRERSILMRIAPHLVHPLAFLVPTYGALMRSRLALGAALLLNDLMSFDRNRGADPQKVIPRGKLVSRDECLRLAPGIPAEGLTGGAVWHDAHMHNSDRMTLSFVLSASAAGAVVANHVGVDAFVRRGTRVTGVRVRDELGGESIDVQGKLVLNACGPWVDELLKLLDGKERAPLFLHSKAMNLVTRPIVEGNVALGLSSFGAQDDRDALVSKGWRFITLIPWRGVTIAGTRHSAHRGGPDALDADRDPEIEAFLAEINAAYPAAGLRREDVRLVHRGLLPAAPGPGVTLQKDYRIVDHDRLEGVPGLLTMVGVKYTTARDVAEKAVDRVIERLERPAQQRGLSRVKPLYGGDIENFSDYLAREARNGFYSRRLISQYGTGFKDVSGLIEEDASLGEPVAGSSVLKAEVVNAVRNEMAETLESVVLRRTELGSAGHPGREAIETSARLMGGEKGWTAERTAEETEAVEAFYRTRT